MNGAMKKRSSYNPDIIKVIVDRFGVSVNYIQKSLRGDRTGAIPEKIVKAYREMDRESKMSIYKKSNEL